MPQGCEYADQQVAASTGALSLTDQSSAAAPAEAPLPGPAPAQVAGRRALLQAAAVPPPLSAAGPPLAAAGPPLAAAGPPLLAPGPTAGAPGPARASEDAAAAAPESAAAPQDSAGLVQMLCKPVPAQQNVQGSGWHGTGLSNQQVKAIAITAASGIPDIVLLPGRLTAVRLVYWKAGHGFGKVPAAGQWAGPAAGRPVSRCYSTTQSSGI